MQILYILGAIACLIVLVPCVIALLIALSRAATHIPNAEYAEDEDEFNSMPNWQIRQTVAEVHENDRSRKRRPLIL